MANTIKQQREARHLTLEELSEATGISVPHLSRIEASSRGLTLKNALLIARALNCEVVDFTSEFSSSDIEDADRLGLPTKQKSRGDIANLRIHAGMGNGGLEIVDGNETGIVPEQYIDGFWSFPESVRQYFGALKSTYSIPVIGDSMEPTIPGGSIAFIDTTHVVPSPPDLYAVDYGDGLMVKRLELIPKSDLVRVISDNARYQTYELKRELVGVYGKVIASFHWRR